MRRGLPCLILATLTLACARADETGPGATIVVFNRTAPDSAGLAKFYGQQRSIPQDQIVGLSCSTAEEISREEYDADIAEPLRKMFKDRGWWTLGDAPDNKQVVASRKIQFVALIKGMPLKIRSTTATYPGDQWGPGPIATHNESCVDSELSTLPFLSRQISGIISNPYFQSFRPISEFEGIAPLLVCRLDGPTVSVVRRMITDSIATEKTGLWGRAYVDGSRNVSNGFQIGDKWMAQIVQDLHTVGVPVVYDDLPAVFPDGYPVTDCSLYYGWYAGGICGPFASGNFRFLPGAIAVHIHSFSANTLRDPGANWAAPLLMHGAAATLGNVYEPYLQLTPYLDVFNERLLRGLTFGESAYMSLGGLSWMTTIVGDPLYRPFAAWQQTDPTKPPTGDWRVYHDFAVKNKSKPQAEYLQLARQTAARTRNGAMIEDLGSIQARDGNFQGATALYQQARATYPKRDDIIRVVLEEADAWIKLNKRRKAIELAHSVLKIVSPDVSSVPLLKKIGEEPAVAPQSAQPR
jgi:uncharacterized protein (TIGR03790 family)